MPLKRPLLVRLVIIALVIMLPLVLTGIHMAKADQPPVRNESVELNVGDSLVLQSNRLSIQQVFVQGNLTAATVRKPSQYPADFFELNSSLPGPYQLQVIFSQASDYNINLFVRQGGTNAIDNSTAFYVSGGSFELDVNAYFSPNPLQAAVEVPPSSTSPWDGFANWMGSFGQAFPLWVKAIYLLFGMQFLLVGGLWVRRESARKETATQPIDVGEKTYLWVDIAYKFLLASFVAIVAIMGGELILLFVLRFMFLVSINLLSLWDVFVVGFAAGVVIITYLIRFTLGKAFDLKPLEDE
ncbi:MAG TPA: hypothetical protein VED86_01410 [archaeon]|nr:hypothetical protein [archaeon]